MEQLNPEQPLPITAADVCAALIRLQLPANETVLVHVSLSRIGLVAGGAQSIVEGLQFALGVDGTLMMPTHSRHLSKTLSLACTAGAGGLVANHSCRHARLSR